MMYIRFPLSLRNVEDLLQEAGMRTAEVCRKHGLSQGTFYKFKSKYGVERDVERACHLSLSLVTSEVYNMH